MHLITGNSDSVAHSLCRIETCRSCHNACVDVRSLAARFEQVAGEMDFSNRLRTRLPAAVHHHHAFRVAISGCPNSCSQPQIKDFGAQGRATPHRGEGDCIKCLACVAACREDAVTVGPVPSVGSVGPGHGGAGTVGPSINFDACVQCGACARACPTGALEIGESGFVLMAGGKLGRRPQLAREIAGMAGEAQAVETFRLALELYLARGRGEERFGDVLNREGYGNLMDGSGVQ